MADFRNETLEEEDFDTILSADIEFSGTLNFEKSFLIRGKFSGKIDALGLLMIDRDAVVEAAITASHVIICGQVTGDVTAAEKIELSATGKLLGNITAPEILMETGCIFNGLCTMPQKNPAP
ncbi:MAG: polymer-forming cytoskeletal protein [Treponema sp.]|jgi:cytoskeletal protein CcmA (bactofilin family)|nr:polymer-forming cytoskeletal protein [Treponema sp.]